jgi:hypothetical protein
VAEGKAEHRGEHARESCLSCGVHNVAQNELAAIAAEVIGAAAAGAEKKSIKAPADDDRLPAHKVDGVESRKADKCSVAGCGHERRNVTQRVAAGITIDEVEDAARSQRG